MDSVKADLQLLREIVGGLHEPDRARARELVSRIDAALEQERVEAAGQREALARHETLVESLGRLDTEHRMLFDAIPAMIWLKDANNRILRCNRSAAQTAGVAVSDMEW